MPHARFNCQIATGREPEATGIDDVEFLFSANKNRTQPVSQIASGGEISRLMLSLKAMIGSATALPTIILTRSIPVRLEKLPTVWER